MPVTTDIKDVKGRVAIVTGAVKNSGKMCAQKFIENGASVAITYQQNKEGAEAAAAELSALGGKCIAVQMELTDLASINAGVDIVEKELGPVDIVVNNAAIRPPERWKEVTVEGWDLIINTNLRGPFFLCQRVMPGMIERGFGRFVFHGGVHASFGHKNPAVGAGKLALVGLMRSLAIAGAPHGITANVVVPGFVNTKHDNDVLYGSDAERRKGNDKLPIGRMSEPDDVGNYALFLCSAGAGYVTGQELFVTGGLPPWAPA